MDEEKMTEIESPTTSEVSANQLQYLIKAIEEQRAVIDRNLTRPAQWRGYARREYEGRDAPEVRERLSITYNNLVEKAEEGVPLTLELLLSTHGDLMEGGGQFRSKGVRVGRKDPVRRPHSSQVSSLVERALERSVDGVELPPLAATRLHLELLIIHPLTDSNGRIARLMASYVLLLAGYRSTLLTAVEQHFQYQPRAYARSFWTLRAGHEKDHAPWLITALEAMLLNSMMAGWFRTRQDHLLKAAETSGIPQTQWIQAISDYDLANKSADVETLSNATGKNFPPIIEKAKSMDNNEIKTLVTQVERIHQEETDEGRSDEYTATVLKALKQLLE